MEVKEKYLYRTEEDKKIVCEAIDSLQLSGTSNWIDKYEKKLADFWKSTYAVAVSSGTTAIQSALYVIGIKENDEVIVPPTAPIMTVLPILSLNAIPVFVDTNTNNFGFDITDLRSKISHKTKAIICVPMWGYPFEYKEIKRICDEKNIVLIEDAAQAHGSMVGDKYIGTFGDIGCFSTHDKKILSTGEGGFVLTKNKRIYDDLKAYIQFDYMSGNRYGTNCKLSTLQAALGISGIDRIETQINQRTKNALYIMNKVNNKKIKEIFLNENMRPNYYSLVIQFDKESNMDEVNNLFIKSGISSETIKYQSKCLYENKILSKYKTICKNAENLLQTIETLPVHPAITKEQLDYIVKFLNTI